MAFTTFLIVAPISPLPSATPIPISATKTVPNGAKPVKFPTIDEKIYLIPSASNNDFIARVVSFNSSVFLSIAVYVTEAPLAAAIAETTAMIKQKTQNSDTGCGSLFPPFSIASRNL